MALFWHSALAHPLEQWRLALSLFLLMTALHALLLGLVVNRWTAKPLLTVLLAGHRGRRPLHERLRRVSGRRHAAQRAAHRQQGIQRAAVPATADSHRADPHSGDGAVARTPAQAQLAARVGYPFRFPAGDGGGGGRRRLAVVPGHLLAGPEPSRSALPGDPGQLRGRLVQRVAGVASRAQARRCCRSEPTPGKPRASTAANRGCWYWWSEKPRARRTGD